MAEERVTDRRRELGLLGEKLARDHLLRNGYTFLEANYRTRSGEIDLVTRLGDVLVFVDRTGRALGSPEESVTERKRARLVAAAQEYMQATEAEDVEWRYRRGGRRDGPAGHRTPP